MTNETTGLKEVAKGISVELSVKTELISFDLPEYMTGAEIEAALPEKHLFAVDEVYGVIGTLIAKQSKGEEGTLKIGDWNLFYTEGFVVSALWVSVGGGWGVYAWYRGGGWGEGDRVFSPASA